MKDGEKVHESFNIFVQVNSRLLEFLMRCVDGVNCERTRAGAAIFVQMSAEKIPEMCVRVRAWTSLRCGCARHVHTLIFCKKPIFQ